MQMGTNTGLLFKRARQTVTPVTPMTPPRCVNQSRLNSSGMRQTVTPVTPLTPPGCGIDLSEQHKSSLAPCTVDSVINLFTTMTCHFPSHIAAVDEPTGLV
jgi:hypothetical protein